jgi:hypothetical protein
MLNALQNFLGEHPRVFLGASTASAVIVYAGVLAFAYTQNH